MWYEVRLKNGSAPGPFYEALSGQVDRVHHFWDEPWWPGCFVVRVECDDDYVLWNAPGVDHVIRWAGVADDEKLYGDEWEWVADFFMASSALAATNESEMQTLKLVHCFLNARGYSERDEARFAWKFMWNRLLIRGRLKRYNRKRARQARRAQNAQVAS